MHNIWVTHRLVRGFFRILMKAQKKWTTNMLAGNIDKLRLLIGQMVKLVLLCDMTGEIYSATMTKIALESPCRVDSVGGGNQRMHSKSQ